MKLYTEEQVKDSLWKLVHPFSDGKELDEIVEKLTPIELPSDDEINKCSEKGFVVLDGSRTSNWINGAIWMRDKIQGGSK